EFKGFEGLTDYCPERWRRIMGFAKDREADVGDKPPYFTVSGPLPSREQHDVDDPLPPRFTLLALFAVSTGAAISCGLLRLLGVYAVVLMFGVLIALYWIRVPRPWRAVKRTVTDMLAGIVLPIGCLVFDPGVFRPGPGLSDFNFSVQIF